MAFSSYKPSLIDYSDEDDIGSLISPSQTRGEHSSTPHLMENPQNPFLKTLPPKTPTKKLPILNLPLERLFRRNAPFPLLQIQTKERRSGLLQSPYQNKNLENFYCWERIGTLVLKKYSEPDMVNIVEKLRFQDWEHLFVGPIPFVYELEVVELYVNLEVVDEGRVKSHVHRVQFELSEAVLGKILHIAVVGYAEYDKEKSSNCSLTMKFT
ncbi:hypothetical protein HAX54_040813 [Datura stramonium]|uniref:Uncharacterized protein n=1 Tax=Datura stramonium TaxID=4076 RepID=A0ABS8SKD6_DATST|nr:hypothetical protein [Datura stramonium]